VQNRLGRDSEKLENHRWTNMTTSETTPEPAKPQPKLEPEPEPEPEARPASQDARMASLVILSCAAMGWASLLEHQKTEAALSVLKTEAPKNSQAGSKAEAEAEAGAGAGVAGQKPQALPAGSATFEEILAASQSSPAGTLIVDARDSRAYEMGRIPTAVNLPVRDFAAQWPKVEGKIRAAQTVIIYCSGDTCPDSKKLAKILEPLSLPGIKIYEGGWEEWEIAGGAVEK
jgi:rhodanese-related sulfurtransferase